MYKVTFEKADNGIIKTINDDNLNGNNVSSENKILYELKGDTDLPSTIKILMDLCKDISLPIGNSNTQIQLHHVINWGVNYQPTEQEIKDRITNLKKEIERLSKTLPQTNLIEK